MRSIGVFDSGVGGLTVVAALRDALPGLPIVYLGDTARLPYGTKSKRTVASYSQANVDFLVGRDVDGVVVACNSASALALHEIEAPVPVWGVVEPGAERAAEVARAKVGVLATEATVSSGAYEARLRRLRPKLEVLSQACPLLVPLVEEGWEDEDVTRQVLERYLSGLLAAGVDTLLLGCTHYPLLRKRISQVSGSSVRLVDSAEATSRRVARDLESLGAWTVSADDGPVGCGEIHLFVTDESPRVGRIAERILGEPVAATWVDVKRKAEA